MCWLTQGSEGTGSARSYSDQKCEAYVDLQPQQFFLLSAFLTLNEVSLRAEVIDYLIRGNGVLWLFRSSFFPPFRNYHSPNNGSLHPALPHMSFCQGVYMFVRVRVGVEIRVITHAHWSQPPPLHCMLPPRLPSDGCVQLLICLARCISQYNT